MKLRYLKTETKIKGVETCEDMPKFLHWLRMIPPFRDKEITYTRMSYKLQSLENGKWIDVPTIEEETKND